MTTYGITQNGFVIKRLPTIKSEIEATLRSPEVFGKYINLLPSEVLGQIVGVFSEREALLWEFLEAVCASRRPDDAIGVNLDFVCSLVGIIRLVATETEVTAKVYGTAGTLIPSGTIFSVNGAPEARFLTLNVATIGAGTDEVQEISFDATPDAGAFTLIFDGEETSSLAYDSDATDIQNALNALVALDGVVVTGTMATGFVVTFSGDSGAQAQPLIELGNNTLTASSAAVSVTFEETTAGELPNVEIDCIAETAGATPCYAGTLTIIETPVSGLDSVTNETDGDIGRNRETDAELRLRREQSLAFPGSANPDAMRAKLLQLDDVTACIVFTNVEMTTDILGVPAKSYYVVIEGGDEDEIADKIWDVAPAGIYSHGSIVKSVYDSHGEIQTVRFSRPTVVDIFFEIDLEIDESKFPGDPDDDFAEGKQAIKEAVAAYARTNFQIADDVITDQLYIPIMGVAGILDATLRIGKTSSPTTDANVEIDIDEVSEFDTSRIEVTIL